MPTPTTGARDTASFDRIYGTTFEHWDMRYEDGVFNGNELLWVMSQFEKKFVTGGRDYVTTFIGQKNASAEFFAGGQQLSVDTPTTPSFAVHRLRNCKVSVQQQWEESIINSGEVAQLDLLEEQIENSQGAFAELLNTAVKSGTGNGSLYPQGLEEAIFSGRHTVSPTSTNVPENYTRSTVNAAGTGVDNTYGGVDRSATNTAAYAWQNASADMGDCATDTAFSATSTLYKAFKRMLNILHRGMNGPDVVLMSLKPYEDFGLIGEGKATFEKNLGGMAGSFNLPFDHYKYQNVIILLVQDILHSGLVGGEGAANDEMVYYLDTRTWKMVIEQQAYFSWTDWMPVSADRLVRLAHNVFRFTPVCTNPRFNGVHFGYGT